jgi:glycine/D-amino acid oxidase-like deaminating enzyme
VAASFVTSSSTQSRHLASLADAEPVPFWLDDPDRPEPSPALVGDTSADLVVVGGGYTGLWTALLAKEADPGLDVALLEGHEVGWAASGRNGGFCEASITHGLRNGLDRWPGEMSELLRLGTENLAAIEATLLRHGIDAQWERTGELTVATEPWQVADLREEPELAARHGGKVEWLDRDAVRAQVASPTYLGGVWDREGAALVHPARLAWGLAAACRAVGVRLHERTPVRALHDAGAHLELRTDFGAVRAGKVALATNAFKPLLRRVSSFVVPVYDYVLVTEPLSAEQRASIGWGQRQGIGDAGNQFHYYRLTADDRILWGGYDAVHHFGGQVRAEYDQRPDSFATLADHFFTTFPQLEGLRFSHRWGGAIDTCSRFSAFWGTAHRGRTAYVAGYTGLGVGATRFGAATLLDLLDGRTGAAATERTRLDMVRTKPVPFPPEPFRWAAIEVTRRAIARADAREGRRGPWLRLLDRLGLGFDS